MPAEAMHATRVPLQFDTRLRRGNGAASETGRDGACR